MPDSSDFFSPRSRYYGKWTPENLAFDANLQEFAQRVTLICALETGGKLTPEQAYDEIRKLWHQLKRSKKELGIGESTPDTPGGSQQE
ncbi:hypothetical protein NG798_18515 [Ancylothrix sp. C2]|uniref:DUF7219 family protein n=1 Tax=Ancylothrix sp. D3o TaxID=2953691 RepID=UPI0021BB8D3C|nr:hypothetical protein [Ancylothrix sp. D3o]MCT7951800.1 hypothetical protein [Ancylothrix sp. D3o]